MAYQKLNWLNKGETGAIPINKTNLNHMDDGIADLYDAIFPIGQIIIKGDDADYSNWLGFTWERTAVGKVLVGYDSKDTDFNTIGKTGGEKKHKLTIDEMPAHSHKLKGNTNVVFDENSIYPYLLESAKRGYADGSNVTFSGDYEINDTTTKGGGQAHNNMPPYQVVAYWKRVS